MKQEVDVLIPKNIRVPKELDERVLTFARSSGLSQSNAYRELIARGLDVPIVKGEIDGIVSGISRQLDGSLAANNKAVTILRKGTNKGTRASIAILALLSRFLPSLVHSLTTITDLLNLAVLSPDAMTAERREQLAEDVRSELKEWSWWDWEIADLNEYANDVGGMIQSGAHLSKAYAAAMQKWDDTEGVDG
jgi:hypothetical protein